MSKIVAFIPARGGSKGLPRKNIRSIAGKPLIAHTIEDALKSKYINRVIVSTEDEEITDIAEEFGAEVLGRPKELARDESLVIDAIYHMLNFLQNDNYNPDIIIMLQVTSPLRTTEDIDNAIELFLNSNCESIIGVYEAPHTPYWSFKIEKGFLKPLFGKKNLGMRRQDIETVYMPNGAIFISRPRDLYKNKGFISEKLLPYIMPLEKSVDIDNETDLLFAELLIKKYKLK